MTNKQWIVLATVISMALAGCTRHQDEPKAAVSTAPVVQIGVTDVVQQKLVTRTRLGGYVEPRQVIHMTAQSGGRVVYVAGREGAEVMSGQVVLGLDEDKLMADYRSAWAHLAGEMSAMQNAQVQLYSKINGQTTSPMGGPMYDAYERASVPMYNAFQQMMPMFGGGQMMPQSAQQNAYAGKSQARSEYE
ncbi:MAG: hypothetical protein ABL868_06800, partial [Sulfuriferula sp.]